MNTFFADCSRSNALVVPPSPQQLMSDPVRTPSGQVYDRVAIEEYVSDHGRDPRTGEPLTPAALTPAADVVDEIRLFNFRQILGFRKL